MMDPLVDESLAPPQPSARADDWYRYVRDTHARVEESVAKQVGVEKALLPYGPDVVVPGTRTKPSVGIELKIWRFTPKNIPNRVNETLSSAVRYRREFAGDVRLGLMVLLLDVVDDAFEPGGGRIRFVFERMGALLRRGPEDAGFDRVVVGLKGSNSAWSELDADGGLHPIPGFAEAVTRLVDDADQSSLPFAAETKASSGPGSPRDRTRPRLLLIADEWRSRHGGISTFNRELARAFVAADCAVHVAVPRADSDERDEASACGVSLVAPDGIPGVDRNSLLLTRPRFTEVDYAPDVIVGHGRILGPYAYAAKSLFFPRAQRLHVVHMDAERLEAAKERIGGPSRMTTASERHGLEVKLALSADVVAGVGPLLSEAIRDGMRGFPKESPPVVDLRPGLRDWGQLVDPEDPPARRQVLLLARAEDITSKGIDIAARAVAWATARFASDPGDPPVLIVRGVPADGADEVKQRLDAVAAPHTQVILRPYTFDEDTLRPDLWQSRVVIMPSRHEGFGLVAYEAIAAGVPVLVSRESGLARMLVETVPDGERHSPQEILPVAGDETELAEVWGNAIYDKLVDPRAAFARAAAVRREIEAKVTWRQAVERLLDALKLR